MAYISYIGGALALFAISYFIYRKYNMGLAHNSRGQQFRRYLIGSAVTFATIASTGVSLATPQVVAAAVTSLLWICTYNVLYDKTFRGSSPDYDNHIDIAFGVYLMGWLVATGCLLGWLSSIGGAVIMGLAEALLMIVPVVQIGYYVIYRVCIDNAGLQAMLDTDGNEVIEFAHSFSPLKLTAMISVLLLTAVVCVTLNLMGTPPKTPPIMLLVAVIAVDVFLSTYIWKKHHGLFVRTGIAMLYNDIREYKRTNSLYKQKANERQKFLNVQLNVALPTRPQTIIMVIGESGCRDYMSCFTPQPWQTTPWQNVMRKDEHHFTFFDKAYSCAMQTVPTLEKALTEKNLYNQVGFAEACSVVDIAHKAGYTVHWYSNQGHIGSADTPITLVAETADVAKWTKQEIGQICYDANLINFLDEVNPTKNNFVVLHLMGNHFNYTNRYTPEYAAANGLAEGDDVHNYMNSLHYTDHVLSSIFSYAKTHLNLAAMVYYSDHGAMPDARRSPRFLGFGMVRIPMWVYLSDNYIAAHPSVNQALKVNSGKYFTNDLAYELVCGIFDIRSNHYDERNSIASSMYSYTRDMLLTDDGRVKVADDPKP